MMKENNIVVMQGFYGNGIIMEVRENEIDYLLQGILGKNVCKFLEL